MKLDKEARTTRSLVDFLRYSRSIMYFIVKHVWPRCYIIRWSDPPIVWVEAQRVESLGVLAG